MLHANSLRKSEVAIWFTIGTALSSPALAKGMSAETRAWCQRVVPALRETISHDPIAVARAAAKGGDLRYFEVYGVGAYIPGIRDQECARRGNMFKLLDGTADALCSTEHGELQAPASRFAQSYNREIAIQRKALRLPNCNEA